MLGQKLGHQGNLRKPCVCPRDQIFCLLLMKLVRVFASMKYCTCLKMGHIESNTRSLGQIIEYPMLLTEGL